MIVEKDNILVVLYLVSCFSIFLAPAPIYVPLFWLFSIVVGLNVVVRKRCEIDRRAFSLIIVAFLFIILSSVIYFRYSFQSSFQVYFKILTNYCFFIASVLFISKVDPKRYLRFFEMLLVLILVFSFIQVIYKVAVLNLWVAPFNYDSSFSAFAISKGVTIIGHSHKNIWATKLAFIGLVYFGGVYLKVFNRPQMQNKLLMVLWLTSIFYLSSRTGQVVAGVFLIAYFWLSYLRNFHAYARLIVAGVFIAVLWYAIPIAVEKLLRLDESVFNVATEGHGGDGFKARIMLWLYLFSHFSEFNHLVGNGVLFLDSFFEGVFYESNIHNVFATIWIDLGITGVLLFSIIVAKVLGTSKKNLAFFLLLGVPFLAGLMVQYLGYDNDIVVYFSMALIIADMKFNYFRKEVNVIG